MKYKDIFIDVISKNIREDKREGKIKEWMIASEACKNPSFKPGEFLEVIKEKYNLEELDIRRVKIELRNINLNSVEKREKMLANIEKLAKKFKNFLNGDMRDVDKLEGFLKKPIEKDEKGRIKFTYKYLMTYLLTVDKDLSFEKGKDFLNNAKNPYCGKIFRDIFFKICKKEGIKKVRDPRAMLKSNVNFDVDKVVDLENIEENKRVEVLSFELDNCRNTIEILQANLDEITDSLEEFQEECKKEVVLDFFLKLNSSRYGNILDSLVNIEKKVKDLKEKEVKIPREFIGIPIVVKQINKFVKDIGVEPIEKLGVEFEAKCSDIKYMNYNGDPFFDEEEVKKVKVLKGGWKYGDVVISIPTVCEK